MNEMNDRLGGDADLAADYRAAHEAYLASRAEIGARSGIGAVPEIDGISAGGMPTRVKCLHVLVGHSLAAGPGVNPLGDEAIAAISEWWTTDRCYCDGAWDTGGEAPSQDLSRHGPQGLPGDRGPARPGPEAAHRRPPAAPAPPERRHRRRQRGRPVTRVAAVDCGTNSIRLLIADVGIGRRGRPGCADVVREMRVVRLGQGVDATGELAQEALDRTFAADRGLRRADPRARRRPRCASWRPPPPATPATGRSSSTASASILGVEPEVITGDEEAALSFAGASSVLPSRGEDPVLVVDLGGGSTEFVLGNADGVIAARSVDVGCVRMTERHLRSDPPTPEQIAAAEADVDAAISEAARTVPLERSHRRRRRGRFRHHHHGPRAAPAGVLRRRRSTAPNWTWTPCARPAPSCSK